MRTFQVRFSKDILTTMRFLTTELEATLGPDTGGTLHDTMFKNGAEIYASPLLPFQPDLGLRIGIHSGPVTGGKLLLSLLEKERKYRSSSIQHTFLQASFAGSEVASSYLETQSIRVQDLSKPDRPT